MVIAIRAPATLEVTTTITISRIALVTYAILVLVLLAWILGKHAVITDISYSIPVSISLVLIRCLGAVVTYITGLVFVDIGLIMVGN